MACFNLENLSFNPLYLQWEQQPLPVQTMVSMLESFACQASIGIGLGMMTVVGKCVGAKEYEQARQYTISLTKLAWMVCIIFCAIIMLFIQQITLPCENGVRKCKTCHLPNTHCLRL